MKSLVSSLATASVEKDVENAYRAAISKGRPEATWTSPHGTDGYAEWPENVRLLLEAKYDKDLKARLDACGVLGQVILYLKRFEQSGKPLPNVILIGDRNECLVLSTEALKGFLDLPLDWSVAPSKGDPALTRALVEGVNILPYVYDVEGKFNFRTVLDKIETLAAGEQHSVRATEQNLGAIFLYWKSRVFQEGKGKQKLTATEQVDVFLRCLFQPADVYLHPSKRGVLHVPGYPAGVLVDVEQYRSFFDHFAQGYRPSEVTAFFSMKDRLVEDDERRRQGAFFTPDLWVAEAHKEMARVLGPNWRDECIVWDPAAGTANLTRDYQFGELISSTAERPDVAAMEEQGWGGSHVFQYDFLNPDSESPFFEPEDGANRIPDDVDAALRAAAASGKRLVFLMNPPYGTAASIETFKSSDKKGVGATLVNGEMKDAKLGTASGQLYAQFMFQARKIAEKYGFAEHTLGLFCVPTFMSSGSYRKFRDWWYGSHEYKTGFMFQANHFADVSGRWGVSFTVWSAGPGATTDRTTDLPIRLCDEKGFAVVTTGIKSIYNSDGHEASKWVRGPVKGLKGVDAPQMSSGLKPTSTKYGRAKQGTLAYCNSLGNNLTESADSVYFLSGASSRGQDFALTSANWRRAVALYGARKLVHETWSTQKDEYRVPDETLPGYDQWIDDCHVYALVHRYNQCSAMRDVQYKGKSWRIKNHWFWKTRKEAMDALDTRSTHKLYRDCKAEPTKTPTIHPIFGADDTPPWEVTGDPYFAHVLPTLTPSPDAQRVLDLLDALWVKSLPYRETYYAGRPIKDKQPDLHLLAWDAGVYQLKHLWRDLFPDEWAELREAHKALAERLKPGVYDFGFLK